MKIKMTASKTKSVGEETFYYQCLSDGVPLPEREFMFWVGRKFRFDFAWPDKKIAVEVEGGVFTGGRHTRPTGFIKDAEKYNEATRLGWKVFRFTTQQVEHGEAIAYIKEILK